MNCLKLLSNNLLKVTSIPRQTCNLEFKRFRKPSPCDVCLFAPEKKPCFDIRNVSIEQGTNKHGKIIRSFLFSHYWPREPSVVGLWMCLNSTYLDVLTDKYSHSGDRFLAYEYIPRTNERKLVGVSVANRIYPWMADELEEWAHCTNSKPERNRMYFTAHCLRSPNLYKKYNVPYLYESGRAQKIDHLLVCKGKMISETDTEMGLLHALLEDSGIHNTFLHLHAVEVLATASEVAGQGVGTMLLQRVLAHAEEMRFPLVQVLAVSQYTAKICEKCGMKLEWSMDYTEFIDNAGQRVFFPRRPHHKVSVYVTYYDPKKGAPEPCLPPY